MRTFWQLIKKAVLNFFADSRLSRGAAIAYYTVFSLAPVLVVVIAVAGLVFGQDAARAAVIDQLEKLMGHKSAELVQTMLEAASNHETGVWATVIGIGTLMITASGVFGEMQSSLNVIWKAQPRAATVSRLVRARIASLGLVVALGFLLIVSLVVNAALAAVGGYLNGIFPAAELVLSVLNFVVSLALIAALFAAIYKVLPDQPIAWRDVAVGAIATSILFTIGKTLIGLYLGRSPIASGFGAAGALALVFVWVYYSAQIFLLGAEFTKVYAEQRGSSRPASRAS